MRRRHADERVEPYRHRIHSNEGHQLRDVLAVWAASVVDELAKSYPRMPDGIEDRDADVWEPLLALADAAGGDWPKRAREAAVSLVSDAKEAEPSLGIRLLADCKTVFGTMEVMFTHALLNVLHELPEAPWSDLKSKPLNDRGLAVRLRQYGIKSKQVRIGETTAKGYVRADFVDVWKRYLPSLPPSDRSETRETSETNPISQGPGASETPPNVSAVSPVSLVGDDGGGMSAARSLTTPSDFPDLPASLRRTPTNGPLPLCDNCGQPVRATELDPWPWPGRPGGINLHSSCEGPWWDSERGQRQ